MRQSDRPRSRAKAAAPPAPSAAPTMRFEGTAALIRLGTAASVTQVLYDGHPLAPGEWQVAADGDLHVACPPIAFDARPHTLEIACAAGAPVVLPFRSEYRGAIEVAGDTVIRGWILDLLRPASALTLSVRCGDAPAFSVRNTLDREDAAEVPEGGAGSGFAITLPPRARAGVPELVTITVEGSRHQPFGPILRGTTALAAREIAGAAARRSGTRGGGAAVRHTPAARASAQPRHGEGRHRRRAARHAGTAAAGGAAHRRDRSRLSRPRRNPRLPAKPFRRR